MSTMSPPSPSSQEALYFIAGEESEVRDNKRELLDAAWDVTADWGRPDVDTIEAPYDTDANWESNQQKQINASLAAYDDSRAFGKNRDFNALVASVRNATKMPELRYGKLKLHEGEAELKSGHHNATYEEGLGIESPLRISSNIEELMKAMKAKEAYNSLREYGGIIDAKGTRVDLETGRITDANGDALDLPSLEDDTVLSETVLVGSFGREAGNIDNPDYAAGVSDEKYLPNPRADKPKRVHMVVRAVKKTEDRYVEDPRTKIGSVVPVSYIEQTIELVEQETAQDIVTNRPTDILSAADRLALKNIGHPVSPEGTLSNDKPANRGNMEELLQNLEITREDPMGAYEKNVRDALTDELNATNTAYEAAENTTDATGKKVEVPSELQDEVKQLFEKYALKGFESYMEKNPPTAQWLGMLLTGREAAAAFKLSEKVLGKTLDGYLARAYSVLVEKGVLQESHFVAALKELDTDNFDLFLAKNTINHINWHLFGSKKPRKGAPKTATATNVFTVSGDGSIDADGIVEDTEESLKQSRRKRTRKNPADIEDAVIVEDSDETDSGIEDAVIIEESEKASPEAEAATTPEEAADDDLFTAEDFMNDVNQVTEFYKSEVSDDDPATLEISEATDKAQLAYLQERQRNYITSEFDNSAEPKEEDTAHPYEYYATTILMNNLAINETALSEAVINMLDDDEDEPLDERAKAGIRDGVKEATTNIRSILTK